MSMFHYGAENCLTVRPATQSECYWQLLAERPLKTVNLVWRIVSVPRHVPQYVQDSVSNVSHLPAVKYRVQRWIKIHENHWEEKNFLESDTRTVDSDGNHRNNIRQIANQKHEIHIEYTNGRFNEACKICHLTRLRSFIYLQGLNLILVLSDN